MIKGIKHGTTTGYYYEGCKCKRCTQAMRDTVARQNRNKALGIRLGHYPTGKAVR